MSIPRKVVRLTATAVLLLTNALSSSVLAQPQTDRKSAWQQLLLLVDKDLHKLEDNDLETVNGFANTVVSKREETQGQWLNGGNVRLRFVWKLMKPKPRIILFDSPTGFTLPGQHVHYVYFFDEAGNPLGSSKFSSGWRMMTTGVKLVRNQEDYLVQIHSWGGGSFAFNPSLRQFYVLQRDRAVLVRLEGMKSLAINSYGCDYPGVGPPIPTRTAHEWMAALSSKDRVEVLQTLMWLAGHRLDLEALKSEQEDEDNLRKRYPEDQKLPTTLERCSGAIDEATVFAQIKAQSDLYEKLRALSNSKDTWVREAAELALAELAKEPSRVREVR